MGPSSLLALSRSARTLRALAATWLLGGALAAGPAAAGQDIPRVRPAPPRPPGAETRGIPWLRDVDAALAEARERGRPMMIEFWADWCGPCHLLEERTFSDRAVIEAARRFVTVRIDFDHNPRLARRFEVVALPAVLFTDSYGTEFLRLNGFVEPKPFLQLLGRVPEDIRPFNALSRRLLDSRQDFQALLELGLLFRKQGLLEGSTYFLQEAVRAGNGGSPVPPRLEEALYYLGENHIEAGEWHAAIAAFTALLERFPNGARVPVAHLEVGKAYLVIGERARARAHLTPLLGRGEQDRIARQAREVLGRM